MPELPEAETIVQGLRSSVVGRSVERVEVLREDLLSEAATDFSGRLTHTRIEQILRRGKNVVLRVVAEPTDEPVGLFLVVNLGMSGRLLHRQSDDSRDPPSHPGIRFHLNDGSLLVYHDVRRFGRLTLMTRARYTSWSTAMGPEPLSKGFRGSDLIGELAQSRSPVRSWLLDQRRIAGVGNIYANEALGKARIHPQRAANDLTPEEGRRLHRALRRVLRAAVEAKGTTLRDYRTSEGQAGSYAPRLRVYGRQGGPCDVCESTIQRVTFGGRSAFFCPVCQPL